MAVLSSRQEEILLFIIKRIKEKGYPPSVREICANVGLASTSTVHAHLARLEEKGIIRKDPTKPRALEIVDPEYADFNRDPNVIDVPIVSKVTREISEHKEGYFKLGKDVVGSDSVFILKATEDIPKPSSIFNGDYLIVREQVTANDEDMIVAITGLGSGKVKNYSEGDILIGRVIGVFRTQIN